MNGFIYKVEFNNGMSYVGQSTQTISSWRNRYKQEIRKYVNGGYGRPIVRKIVEDGLDENCLEIIIDGIDNIDELNSIESFYIGMFNSFESGYNRDVGGTNVKRESVNKVICMQTLEVFNSIIDCSRSIFNMNRHNANLKRNLDGEIDWYRGMSFEYYDENKEYKMKPYKEVEIAHKECDKYLNSNIYVDLKSGIAFETLQSAADHLGITRQAFDYRCANGISAIKIKRREYLK
ncbi:MAG: hypothetical protein ACRDDH_05780 [Cetobacterium sp.]|uniref:hypothetical protein n=1 Tax=Cetobacterium sp. TaxID=2071632 RepID=UPI003EE503E7